MDDASPDELRRVIASARAYAAEQREQARGLESELPALNQRLGAARRRQEHMQRPSTLVTETARERLDGWLARLRRVTGRARA
jgi:hypothetical protein